MLRRLLPFLVAFGVVLLLGIVQVVDPYPVQVLREIAFDYYQRLKPRPPSDFPVRVVDIDEASLAEIGQWPWPRDRLALLTDRLTELGAAAIAYDALFPEHDRMSPSRIAATIPGVDPASLPDTDKLFAEALGRSPSILGFSSVPNGPPMSGVPKGRFAISGPDPTAGMARIDGVAAPLPELRDAAAGLATVSLNKDLSNTAVRRLPMLWSDGTLLYPTLSLEALRIALGGPTMIAMGDMVAAGYIDAVRVGGYTIPLTSGGDLWLYYSRPDPSLYVSAKDILGPDYPKLADRISGQIVLIGTSASGLLDIHTTTLGDTVPGVSIHAQAIQQVLSETYLTRPDWARGLEIVGFVLLGALLVIAVLALGPLVGLAAGALSIGGTVGFSWWMFASAGIMFDPAFPLVGLTLLYLALIYFRFLATDVAKKQIRRAFGYYVDPTLLAEIEKNGDKLKLGGELREVTVMFSDVRGFTPLSEKLTPVQILALLNTMFGALGAEITGRFGTIDKFIGDAIMAFWNAPVDVPNHPARACDAALAMRQRMRQLNETDAFGLRRGGSGIDRVVIGVGISTGEALVGNMGLETRFDYSALGDTVNTASRVEGACKETGYDLLVTSSTRDAAPGFAMLPAGGLALKGKAERVPIHLLVGDEALAGTEAFRRLADAHASAIAALVSGAELTGPIAACLALIAEVEPGLAKFYALLPERRDDFAPAQPALPEAAE